MTVPHIRDSARSGDHQVYTWSGSPYEIGRQHGETLRREIVEEYAPALQKLAAVHQQDEARVLSRHRALYEPVFRDLVPRAVEEIRGLADGARLSYDEAFFAATRDGVRLPEKGWQDGGCTAFFCAGNTTASGNIIMGQTKDTPSLLTRYRIFRLRYDDGLSAVQLGYPGWVAHVGLSSKGLASTGNSLSAPAPSQDTVPFSLLKRLVMEKKTIPEVLAAISSLYFENCCLIIGSSSGDAVCIEYVAGRSAIFDLSGKAFGHANSILDPQLKPYECPSEDAHGDLASSDCRQKNVQHFLDENAGQLDIGTLQAMTASHCDYPHSICRHGMPGESRTTAAFITDLSASSVHVAIGNPCVAPFREYSLSHV